MDGTAGMDTLYRTAVYDQELLAIAAALNGHRIYIEGCASFVVIHFIVL